MWGNRWSSSAKPASRNKTSSSRTPRMGELLGSGPLMESPRLECMTATLQLSLGWPLKEELKAIIPLLMILLKKSRKILLLPLKTLRPVPWRASTLMRVTVKGRRTPKAWPRETRATMMHLFPWRSLMLKVVPMRAMIMIRMEMTCWTIKMKPMLTKIWIRRRKLKTQTSWI